MNALILTLFILVTDPSGVYASDPLHSWFANLSSGKGPCCSFADGRQVNDPDWGTTGGSYWVVVDGNKLTVPDSALVTVPNKFRQAVVWPYFENGALAVRCFMPGPGA